MKIKNTFTLFKDSAQGWSQDKASQLSAALSYYTIFSLAPLLVIVIAVAGLVFGQQAAQNQIVGQIQGVVGQSAAQVIQTMIAGARKPSASIIATVISVVFLLAGATGLFGQLQNSLNSIWEVAPKPNQGIWNLIKTRFLSFAMILVIGFLLLVSLVLSAALSGFSGYLARLIPGLDVISQVVNFVISFAVVTLLFALIYKYLPDAKISWRDVWWGAIVTALLFTIGKFLIGFYLGKSSVTSSYGAAGSLVLLLLWVYYSGLILFFGAEFTKSYAILSGSPIAPSPNAEWASEAEPHKLRIPRQEAAAPAAQQRKAGADSPASAEAAASAEARASRPAPGGTASPSPSQSPVNSALARQADERAAAQARSQAEQGPRTPAQKSMTALGAITVVLVGYVTSLIARASGRRCS